jgi:hypothetical protein
VTSISSVYSIASLSFARLSAPLPCNVKISNSTSVGLVQCCTTTLTTCVTAGLDAMAGCIYITAQAQNTAQKRCAVAPFRRELYSASKRDDTAQSITVCPVLRPVSSIAHGNLLQLTCDTSRATLQSAAVRAVVIAIV